MEQALAAVYAEGEKAFHTGSVNPYPNTDQYWGEWTAGWTAEKLKAENKNKVETIENIGLSKNKQKAIKQFSEMIAKDCAELIETVIEKRVRMYATHLAEIMQKDD